MADDTNDKSSPMMQGDYGKVPIQIAPGGTGTVSRPTKGTQLIWGGSDPSSPWGTLQALIQKGGGEVNYLHVGAGTVAASSFSPTGAPGDAPATGSDSKSSGGDDSESGPQKVDAKPHPDSPGLEHVTGPIGTGALFDAGVDVNYQGEPARLWAHPRAAHSGPRPLIIYLHGINASGLEHPALSSNVGQRSGGWMHMGKLAHELITAGKVTPLAMAAPTNAQSAPWDKIDYEELLNLLEQKFKEAGVEIDLDQITVVGHSGAGGYPGRGMNKLADQHAMIGTHKLKVFGLADTQIIAPTATLYKTGLSANDTTAIYALHRGTGGWATAEYNANGGSAPFAQALGATNANKTREVADESLDACEEYWDNQDELPARVSIKVKQPLSTFVTLWRAAGGYGVVDQGNHANALPCWTWWALPRFYAQTAADQKLLAAMAMEAPATPPPAPIPAPPPAPTANVSGGEFNIPPAAKPWVNPAGEIAPKALDGFEFSKPTGLYYPVRAEKLPAGRGVYYIGEDGVSYGPGGRGCGGAAYFLADRSGGTRKHVGVDVSINAFNSMVVACESGRIVNFYWFYQNAWCIVIQCTNSPLVINYSEVDANSLKDNNLKVGSSVVAGQPIGTIRKMDTSAMLHFENYRSGTTANCNLYPDGPDAAKQAKSKVARARLYNPTQYLLALAKSGR